MKTRVKFLTGGEELAVELEKTDAGPPAAYDAVVGGDELSLRAHSVEANTLRVEHGGHSVTAHVTTSGGTTRVFIRGRVYELTKADDAASGSAAVIGSPEIRSTMPGKILAVLVAEGDTVAAGDDVIILEAMKMENRLRAEIAGTVEKIEVREGDRVEGGDVLVRLTAASPRGVETTDKHG